MLNLEKIVVEFAKQKKIELTSFSRDRIRNIQRKAGEMTTEEILKELSLEDKFRLAFDRNDWKNLEKIIERNK